MYFRVVCSISTKMQENGALEHGAPAQNQNIVQERFKSVASVREFHEALTTPRRIHADAAPGCNEKERARARTRAIDAMVTAIPLSWTSSPP